MPYTVCRPATDKAFLCHRLEANLFRLNPLYVQAQMEDSNCHDLSLATCAISEVSMSIRITDLDSESPEGPVLQALENTDGTIG